jgi:hypothetical protein
MKKTLLSLIFGALIGFSGFAQNLVTNGSFELPDDGSKHLFITERTAWLSDDLISNRNGTEYNTGLSGNFYWFNVNIAGTIYQPIDIITSDSALYHISYNYGTVYNADAGNDTIYSVIYFSHYTPGSSIKNRKLIDSIVTDVTSVEWKTLVKASFKLPANTSYVGDSLVVEFATRVVDHHAVNNNTWAGADSIVITKTVVAPIAVINPGFELPDDSKKHLFITERSGWYSDDAIENHNGTEYSTNMSGNYYWFNVNTAGTIYQPIDKITRDSALYKVSYFYGTVWNADAGNDTMYSVVYFSHYTPGTSMKTRKLIDSIAVDVTSASWKSLITVSFKLPASVSYAGDSLIIEFATRVVDHHAINNNTWAGADSISILKTGIYTGELGWKEFNVATKVDTSNITSSSDFSVKAKIAWDSKFIYLKLNVIDDSIFAVGNEATYNLDNIEIYFDMNNKKTPAWPRGQSIWPSSYDGQPGTYQLRLIPSVPFDTVNTSYKGWGIQEYQVTETGYNYDLKFYIDSLLKDYVSEVGKKIGFDILASDNDNDPYYRDQLSIFAPSASIWCDAAMWGTLSIAENGGFEVVYDKTKPRKASNLQTEKGNKQVLLKWEPATDNIVVEKYIILVNDKVYATIYAKKTDNSCVVKDITTGDYTFSVIAEDIAGNKSDKISTSFTYDGVDNSELSSLSIYPNPSFSYISLNNETRVNMEVYSATGQLLILKSVNAGEKINISSLSNGIYTLRIIESNNVSLLKLVKK